MPTHVWQCHLCQCLSLTLPQHLGKSVCGFSKAQGDVLKVPSLRAIYKQQVPFERMLILYPSGNFDNQIDPNFEKMQLFRENGLIMNFIGEILHHLA